MILATISELRCGRYYASTEYKGGGDCMSLALKQEETGLNNTDDAMLFRAFA